MPEINILERITYLLELSVSYGSCQVDISQLPRTYVPHLEIIPKSAGYLAVYLPHKGGFPLGEILSREANFFCSNSKEFSFRACETKEILA